ncbi:MAG TPA: serine hydrolase domain-containing protein [Planctomycetaceae bacterium]|jgi:CubicO group peptidase (beta-lactamase class C family)|nr:serine hydrolase domain-containing protein [Planctomycetaceae bacterium]
MARPYPTSMCLSGMRPLLCGIACAFAVSTAAPLLAKTPTPTGTPVRAYAPLDRLVMEFMDRCECRSATLAVSRQGKLLFSRGYGWNDQVEKKRTLPDALLRIGGVTEPITAAAVRKLIQQGKFSLDTKAFPYLHTKPLRFANPDPRLNDITVGQLLEHRGGWNQNSVDPFTNLPTVGKVMRVTRRPRPLEIVRYMMTEPLQFDPGQQQSPSNFGYCVLGRIIEKATAKSYGNYIKEDFFKSLGVEDVRPAKHFADQRDLREVWYPVRRVPIETMDSFAGLVASAPALCKFLDAYWVNGEPRASGDERQWTYYGNIVATTAFVRQRLDGYNIAILFAVRKTEPLTEQDDLTLARKIDEEIDKIGAADPK